MNERSPNKFLFVSDGSNNMVGDGLSLETNKNR